MNLRCKRITNMTKYFRSNTNTNNRITPSKSIGTHATNTMSEEDELSEHSSSGWDDLDDSDHCYYDEEDNGADSDDVNDEHDSDDDNSISFDELTYMDSQHRSNNVSQHYQQQQQQRHQQYSPTNLEVYDESEASCNSFEQDQLHSFHDTYHLEEALGAGAFGKVYSCSVKTNSTSDTSSLWGEGGGGNSSSFAVKSVPAELFNADEIEILDDLKECPHIVGVQDVFHDLNESFIVMEKMEGGDLLTRLAQKEAYSEDEAKVFFKTLLETVLFCHEHGIAHCDIKPENILLKHQDDDTSMQLADFGLAKRFLLPDGSRQALTALEGTAEYAAPEVFSHDEAEGYDERCDIWSCGIILYLLLAGYVPFDAENPMEIMAKSQAGKVRFHKRYWNDISDEAKDLIVALLQVNPDERCSLQQALASPWFESS